MPATRLVAFAGLLITASVCSGLGFESFGPRSSHPTPTTVQPGWPAGMATIVDHDSRVYHRWVNGSESHYFLMAESEIPEMLRAFSRLRLRDHVVTVKPGLQTAKSFHGQETTYNVAYHYWGGIARHMRQREPDAVTHEPTLTICVDPKADRSWWTDAKLPDNLIINSEVDDWPARGAAAPKRRLWHARVQFQDGGPAADFENRIATRVNWWDPASGSGIYLGQVDYQGKFRVALSDQEIAQLKSGENWITLTVGDLMAAPQANHPRLPLESLSPDPEGAPPRRIDRPRVLPGRKEQHSKRLDARVD